MHLDVVQFRDFYDGTHLGAVAQRNLQLAFRALWPDVKGETLAGVGFAVPFLRPFLQEAGRVVALMPAPQGVCKWPREGPNLSALVEEAEWPFTNGFFDRIILAHALESCEQPRALLDEVWRALAPGGRLIAAVPSRSGLWARHETTPFGFGRPYSANQLESLLKAAGFTPQRRRGALYAPPSERRFWLRAATAIERAGGRWRALEPLAGVRIIEAVKEVYALPKGGAAEAALAPRRWRPLATPALAPSSRGEGDAPAPRPQG